MSDCWVILDGFMTSFIGQVGGREKGGKVTGRHEGKTDDFELERRNSA